MELRWARGAGKTIVCIVRAEDKSKVHGLFSYAPIFKITSFFLIATIVIIKRLAFVKC